MTADLGRSAASGSIDGVRRDADKAVNAVALDTGMTAPAYTIFSNEPM
jgi:hypothetical protein